ncbi:unnamed protein product [Durusdinium trenchii]|uniref:Uncharacterized protein n=2 Tax=Durusdinium trenchii TaxID=1381693 RepID=A0ABP0QVE5_9DINO
MPLFNLSLFAKSRSTVESRGRCNGAMPTSGLYALLQKARPGWSSKDLLKVYQKLQKVSITDGESLARAVSEGSLNQVLAAAGERKLKPSTLQLLRLASRDPTRGHREAVRVEPLQPKRCFCGSCIRVPLCKPRGPSSQLLKLPSVGCSLPPLMPSKRRVMVPLPRIKSEPCFGHLKRRSAGEHHKGRNGLQSSNSVGHLRVPALPALVEPRVFDPPLHPPVHRLPIRASVEELTEEPTEWQRYWEATKLEGRLETVEEGSWVPSALSSRASSNSFNSYLTFVGKKGPDAPESDEVIGEFEEALCTQESYRMSFDGSDSDDSLEEAEVTVHPMPPRLQSSTRTIFGSKTQGLLFSGEQPTLEPSTEAAC